MNLFYNLPIELQQYILYLNPDNRKNKNNLIKKFDIEITNLYNKKFLYRNKSKFFKKFLTNDLKNKYNKMDYPLTCIKDFYYSSSES